MATSTLVLRELPTLRYRMLQRLPLGNLDISTYLVNLHHKQILSRSKHGFIQNLLTVKVPQGQLISVRKGSEKWIWKIYILFIGCKGFFIFSFFFLNLWKSYFWTFKQFYRPTTSLATSWLICGRRSNLFWITISLIWCYSPSSEMIKLGETIECTALLCHNIEV